MQKMLYIIVPSKKRVQKGEKVGKIIYYEFKKCKVQQCEEQKERTETIEKILKELRNSTIEVIKSTGNFPKLDITQLTEAEKEKFYNKAIEKLHKDKEYIKTLIREKR